MKKAKVFHKPLPAKSKIKKGMKMKDVINQGIAESKRIYEQTPK